ncbi:aconitase family protein [uncultured Enterobacter sp.]|uniref:aconitase family protein n=1 Tax=uncultured Enterobacter sp. TaxID=238202 RepID=UPI002599D288|nr:aconitase family protein [uncultured Enterobacter sp.]
MKLMLTQARILFLAADPNKITAQLRGESLSLAQARPLRDNISTDEITPIPALAYYDERLGAFAWTGLKCGAENPIGKNAIVEAGMNVVVGGLRYGKGSSREHSPVAEKSAGVQLVIAESFERIYRQNADNIGLLTSTNMALVDKLARGEALTLEEIVADREESARRVIQSGGLLAWWKGQMEKSGLPPLAATSEPKPMTLGEKIIARHRLEQGDFPGTALLLRPDWRFIHEYYTAMCGHMLKRTFGRELTLWQPDSIITFEDHLPYMHQSKVHIDGQLTGDLEHLLAAHRAFTQTWGLTAHRYNPDGEGAEGISHALMAERHALPGQLIIGTDSHTPHCGALGCLAVGVGSTDMAGSMVTGAFRMTPPETVKVVFTGTLPEGTGAKDMVLHLLATEWIRQGGGIGKIFEFCGEAVEGLSVDERATLTNMVAELGGVSGLVAPDAQTVAFLKARRGIDFTIEAWMRSDEGAHYASTMVIDCIDLAPMIALPGDPGNGLALSSLSEPVKIDIAYGGSCTAGKRDDFDEYHAVLDWALSRGKQLPPDVTLYLQFGTMDVYDYCREQGYLETFHQAGAILLKPACGACANCGPGSSVDAGQVTISAINRNFPGRSGPGKVWLGSPSTVVASAIKGEITSFNDLKRQYR